METFADTSPFNAGVKEKNTKTNKVVDFEAALIAYMNANQTTLMDKISKNGDYNDEIPELNKSVSKKI
jgi:F-type H+-transporting ATPase subunit alpha